MRTLLVVAHGSRRAESNEEVRALTRQLAGQAGAEFHQVSCAFLELAEPSIPDGLRDAISQGAHEVVVLPYFLSAGRHVVSDIPAEIDVVRAESPGVTITLATYLGAADGLVQLMMNQVR
jgi:sirohydrochlorin ferrochelatase